MTTATDLDASLERLDQKVTQRMAEHAAMLALLKAYAHQSRFVLSPKPGSLIEQTRRLIERVETS